MQLGIIGLGKMGGNIARRLMQKKHDTVVFDRSSEAVAAIVKSPFLAHSFTSSSLMRPPGPLPCTL